MEHDGCKGCKYEKCVEDSKECQGCKQNAVDKYTRMTNADRIRAMTDEELSKLIAGLSEHCLAGIGACDCINIETHPCYEVCEEIAMNWLQSEIEE